jgi:hypothetical protein
MDLRIALKIGKIEMEFEGSNEMFETKIDPIIKDLLTFGKESVDAATLEVAHEPPMVKSGGVPQAMTIKSIAGKLNVDSGGELLYASVASLSVIRKKETITRKEINDEMKLAIGYYKVSYTNNLTSYLDTMIKQGSLIEVSKDNYAVKTSERQAMEKKLAE